MVEGGRLMDVCEVAKGELKNQKQALASQNAEFGVK